MLGDPIRFLSFFIINQLWLSYPSLFLIGPSQTSSFGHQNSNGVFAIKSADRVESEITSITPPTGIPWEKKFGRLEHQKD